MVVVMPPGVAFLFAALVLAALAAFGLLVLAQRLGDPVLPGGHGLLSSMACGNR